jgi:cation:H+ antiporter
VVAAGTSLPEVATSVLASVRGEGDIAVGNVVGSNLSNLLLVLGVSGTVAPGGIPVSEGALTFDLPVMVASAVACLPIFFTDARIDRWEGGLFLGYYVAYTTYIVLTATGHASAPLLRVTMLWFVLPLTALTLAILAGRALYAKQAASEPQA